MMAKKKQCEMCGGVGHLIYTRLVGYVTREMAKDAGCMEMEGWPLTEDVDGLCPDCNGVGFDEDEG